MHELAVAASLFEWAEAQARALAPRRVVAIELERDPLSCLNPDALVFGFQGIAAGTTLAEVRLQFTPIDPTYVCRVCGASHVNPSPPLDCSSCGAPFPRLPQGDSLQIVSIEVEDDTAYLREEGSVPE